MFAKTGKMDWYADPATIYCPAVNPALGTTEHLNSTLPPDDPQAAVAYEWMSTDPADNSQMYVYTELTPG